MSSRLHKLLDWLLDGIAFGATATVVQMEFLCPTCHRKTVFDITVDGPVGDAKELAQGIAAALGARYFGGNAEL